MNTTKKISKDFWIYRGHAIKRTPGWTSYQIRGGGRSTIYTVAIGNTTERCFTLAEAKAWIDSNLDGSAVAR